VISGFPADIAALSLLPDIQLIADAGLITHDVAQDPEGSIVATSAVVFDVRPGNPLNIDNWDDLTQPGVEILTPDPASSGARWNIVAAYRAHAGRGARVRRGRPATARRLLTDIF
jgi:sulfate transport system substrate-binding protein